MALSPAAGESSIPRFCTPAVVGGCCWSRWLLSWACVVTTYVVSCLNNVGAVACVVVTRRRGRCISLPAATNKHRCVRTTTLPWPTTTGQRLARALKATPRHAAFSQHRHSTCAAWAELSLPRCLAHLLLFRYALLRQTLNRHAGQQLLQCRRANSAWRGFGWRGGGRGRDKQVDMAGPNLGHKHIWTCWAFWPSPPWLTPLPHFTWAWRVK